MEIPERIWLQTGDSAEHGEADGPVMHTEDMTWCVDSVYKHDTEYVRADLYQEALSKLRSAEAQRDQALSRLHSGNVLIERILTRAQTESGDTSNSRFVLAQVLDDIAELCNEHLQGGHLLTHDGEVPTQGHMDDESTYRDFEGFEPKGGVGEGQEIKRAPTEFNVPEDWDGRLFMATREVSREELERSYGEGQCPKGGEHRWVETTDYPEHKGTTRCVRCGDEQSDI